MWQLLVLQNFRKLLSFLALFRKWEDEGRKSRNFLITEASVVGIRNSTHSSCGFCTYPKPQSIPRIHHSQLLNFLLHLRAVHGNNNMFCMRFQVLLHMNWFDKCPSTFKSRGLMISMCGAGRIVCCAAMDDECLNDPRSLNNDIRTTVCLTWPQQSQCCWGSEGVRNSKALFFLLRGGKTNGQKLWEAAVEILTNCGVQDPSWADSVASIIFLVVCPTSEERGIVYWSMLSYVRSLL